MNEQATSENKETPPTARPLLSGELERLLPCPFCGAEAEIITLEGEDGDVGIGAQCVQCTNHGCGAASGLVYPLGDDVTELLIERWNKRSNA